VYRSSSPLQDTMPSACAIVVYDTGDNDGVI
jgi:hypothetical protein